MEFTGICYHSSTNSNAIVSYSKMIKIGYATLWSIKTNLSMNNIFFQECCANHAKPTLSCPLKFCNKTEGACWAAIVCRKKSCWPGGWRRVCTFCYFLIRLLKNIFSQNFSLIMHTHDAVQSEEQRTERAQNNVNISTVCIDAGFGWHNFKGEIAYFTRILCPYFFRCNYHWHTEILVLFTQQLLYLGPVR